MKFGCCLNMVSSGPDGTGMEWIPQAAMAGCDYLELPLAEIMHVMEPEFLALKQRLGDGGIRCRACNNFFPGKLRLIGERQERERALKYAYVALQRAGSLGASCVVFGSGAARCIPDGISYEAGYGQIVGLLRSLSPVAGFYGINLAIEPLRKAECNIINTFKEGCSLAKDVNERNIKVLVDFYHLCEEKESLDHISNYGKGHLLHVHMADPEHRGFLRDSNRKEYDAFFQALKGAGYDHAISFEAYSRNFINDLKKSLIIGNELWQS